MTGPTVEGSIVANVKADISNLEENIALAQAKIEELTGRKPDVTVKANVDTALTKLQAVEAATERVQAADTRLTAAVKALEISESSEGRKAATMLPIRHEATDALKEATAASLALAAAQAALAKEEEKAAAAGVKSKAAGGGGPASFFQLALVAVAALVPLLAPLAGYVAAVTGAFAGMGAAGVLAVLGIKNAMADGTIAGSAFASGLHSLKGSLDSLSATSANAMLFSFQQAASMISANLPSLNYEIGTFSRLLGSTGNIVLSALISGFQTLLPLFTQAGMYIQQLAVGFQKWTTDGGLQKFADYASTALPLVAHALGGLASLATHLIEALAPLGTVVLQAITSVTSVLNALPIPVLSAFAVAALAAVAAFRGWGQISSAIDSVAKSANSAAPALGGLPGVILAAGAAFDSLAVSGMKASASGIWDLLGKTRTVDQYSTAIARGNLNINDLGTTLSRTSGFVQDFAHNLDFAGTGVSHFYDDASKIDTALSQASPSDLITSYKQLVAEGAKVGVSATDIANRFPQATAAYRAAVAASGDVTVASRDVAGGFATLQGAAITASTSVNNLATIIQGFGSATLSTRDAQRQFRAAVDAVAASVAANGNSLDITTAKGRANQAALDAIATTADKASASIFKQTGSQQDATQAIVDGRKALIDALAQFGITGKAAQDYADNLGLIPANVTTALRLTGITDADQQLAALFKKWSGKTLDMSLFLDTSGGNKAAAAEAARLTGQALQYANGKPRATGGVTGLGELTLVGENGPEWAKFPTGTTIYPNGVKPAMSSRVFNSQTTNNQGGKQVTINAPMTTVVQADPHAAMQDQLRRLNLLTR